MELKMLEVTRKGPHPYAGCAVLRAHQPAPGASWTDAMATLGYQTASGGYESRGSFPLDLGFVPSRVQQANCQWAGLKGPQTVPESPFRRVGESIDWDIYDELNQWANGDDGDVSTPYSYKCDECGLQFHTSDDPDAAHPTEHVVMDSGFGFDAERKLFVASDAPGTLVVLISSEHRSLFGWGKPLPRASFVYARDYGLLAGRQPLHEGQWSDRYSYAVLRTT